MGSTVEVLVPDIGEFEGVEVIEVLVAPGDRVARDASLITIESDKASMEIPSPRAGVVREIAVGVGSRVSQGSLILRLEPEGVQQPERLEAATTRTPAQPPEHSKTAALPQQPERAASASAGEAPQLEALEDARAEASATPRPARSFTPSDRHAEVVVLGAGPGGYTAAFRAADLGKQVVLIERHATLGGVCLNVGCIPSKALLHIAEVISDARALRERGVEFGEPRIDLSRVRESVAGVVGSLTRNLGGLAQRRKISVLQGLARFSAPDQISVETAQGATTLSFEDCIIAAGSQAVELPGIAHDDPRVMDSTAALRLDEIPARLLVIGGGIIGLELAAVYHALGSRISIVELTDELLPGVDRDLVKPLHKRIAKRYERILLGTRVARVEPERDGLLVRLEGGAAPASERFDRVLVA
ncbi:MAG TPA: FAD-dependent oxidoreductase, partial [Myxococcota bacterium]|nr:FAD-dependent oxidoreductase [Myxococcota bacterium]